MNPWFVVEVLKHMRRYDKAVFMETSQGRDMLNLSMTLLDAAINGLEINIKKTKSNL